MNCLRRARVQDDRRDHTRNCNSNSRNCKSNKFASRPAPEAILGCSYAGAAAISMESAAGCQAAWLSSTRAQFAAAFREPTDARPPCDESVQGEGGTRWFAFALRCQESMSMQVESPSPASTLRAGMGIGFLPSPTGGWKQVSVLAERGSSSPSSAC